MRVAIMGKGGSGKTSIASAFVHFLAKRQKVLFIDADVNAHAHECLDMEPSSPLSERVEEVAKYLMGKRKDILPTQMIGATPPSKDSKLIKGVFSDELISAVSRKKNNVSLITVGTYTEEDSGINCYHSKLMPVEMVLHHTIDKKDEYIVMDATAGVDILGTSLFMAFDVIFFIIEPTQKSTSVLKTFQQQTTVPVVPILNKVRNEKDLLFVKEKGLEPSIIFEDTQDLRSFEQGQKESFIDFVEANEANFQRILEAAQRITRDVSKYYEDLSELYKRSCETWYNKYFECNLLEKTQMDKEFLNTIAQ